MAKKISRLTSEILEMAEDMQASGLLEQAAYEKITLRHLGSQVRKPMEELTSQEIREMRERAHMSQSVFAQHLNMSTGQLSKLERGTSRPKGATLALLSVIRRKGIEIVL